MSYKTILVHIDDTSRSPYRVKLAAELAQKFEAHLSGVADTGVARFIYQDGNINGTNPGLLTHLEYLRDRALENVTEFNIQIAKSGVKSFSSEITQYDTGNGMGLRSRYCDLIIVGQTNPNETSPAVTDNFPECMILNSGRPVIVIPYTGEFSTLGKRPLLAWDASRVATRAITDALPLINTAGLVHVVIINPKPEQHGDHPDADIAAWLTRHGIKLDVSIHHTKMATGAALLSIAKELNSDLIVMGGYGHSRFREMIMGGVTRSVLKNMSIPVLFSN